MTGCLPHSPPLSPLPRGPESVTDRGHSLSEASLVTFHALHHYHHHHTVQNLSQTEDTVSVKHHWLPSSLSSTITPPCSPGSVTNRGHSLSQASLVTVVTLFHYHLRHAVQDLSQTEDTVSVKHHWLPSTLSSTITCATQSRMCPR